MYKKPFHKGVEPAKRLRIGMVRAFNRAGEEKTGGYYDMSIL